MGTKATDILSNSAASYALKRWLREALERDPVDALRDAEALVAVLTERLARIEAEEVTQVLPVMTMREMVSMSEVR